MNRSPDTMSSDDALIEAIRIEKRYRQVRAVDGVSLAIGRGSCFGLLGPNGAGKTTLIEIIEDIIAPTAGTVLYKGRPRSFQFRQEVGIMFQQTALLSFLTVAETLETFGRLYDSTDDVETLIRTCHLEDVKDRPNDKISGGQKQRLLLALALLNRPELVFLDEPSTGLDPQARHNLWNIIRRVKEQGKTIVLTTHYMEEAEKLCDDIAIMDKGKVIARGAPEKLIHEHCRRATLAVPKDRIGANRHKFSGFSRERGDKILFRTEDVNGFIQKLLAEGVDLSGVNLTTPNLEDVFLKLTGRSLRE
ncbi:ABC transporter ATP-binding protein [Desulfosarcina widdelii]|uniref:ABC transporter ATP-binding protein n=1 Tax=Desulfosarcina widdelii TaxID=947919 RepID=A0A5K7YZL6_9BACT|nr:ABC transporter ATP-binding protein [Desulfosarcina widdelii]BBO73373.1 ABC transporter ATP-binding protein [Desulfosarcina widdelii]